MAEAVSEYLVLSFFGMHNLLRYSIVHIAYNNSNNPFYFSQSIFAVHPCLRYFQP